MNQLDGIEVFVKVVQCRSFSGAAKQLKMPVTTVSGKVAALEQRLGVTLLHRTTRKVNVTKFGEAYYLHCSKAMDEVAAAEKLLGKTKAEPEGLLKITVPPNIGRVLLPQIIKNYSEKYPKTQIDLMLDYRVVDLVGEGVDLAIRSGILKDSTMIAKKFVEAKISLVASADYIKKYGMPKTPQELAGHNFILFKPYMRSVIDFKRGKETVSVNIKSRLAIDELEAIKLYVLGGHGISMLPPLMTETELAAGKLVELVPDWSIDLGFGDRVRLSFVYPPQRYLCPKVQAFMEMAYAHVAEMKAKGTTAFLD